MERLSKLCVGYEVSRHDINFQKFQEVCSTQSKIEFVMHQAEDCGMCSLLALGLNQLLVLLF